MQPTDPPNGPTAGFELEQKKRRWGFEFRQSLSDAIEKARLYRQQYDDQIAEQGEISRDLHVDLAVAAFDLHDELSVFKGDVDNFPDMKELRKKIYDEGPIADKPDTPAKLFAGYIDALEATALKLGLVEVQNG